MKMSMSRARRRSTSPKRRLLLRSPAPCTQRNPKDFLQQIQPLKTEKKKEKKKKKKQGVINMLSEKRRLH